MDLKAIKISNNIYIATTLMQKYYRRKWITWSLKKVFLSSYEAVSDKLDKKFHLDLGIMVQEQQGYSKEEVLVATGLYVGIFRNWQKAKKKQTFSSSHNTIHFITKTTLKI